MNFLKAFIAAWVWISICAYLMTKGAECDICGARKQFDPAYSMPDDWNEIEDSYGLIRYDCVCRECSQRIRDYIEEFKSLHHKEQEGEG